MNVLIVQPDIRRYRADFFNALAEHTSRVTVAHFGVDESNQSDVFNTVKLKSSPLGRLVSIFTLLKLHVKNDVAIVVFDVHYWNVMVASALASFTSPIIFWGHGLGRTVIGRRLRKACLTWSSAVIMYGDAGRDQLLRNGANPNQIFIARNTLSVPGYKDTSSHKKTCFLYVGRLQERKRLDDLLEAYQRYRLLSKERALPLVILGSGQIEPALKQLTHDLGLGKEVTFIAGTTEPEKLKPIFSQALAYVSPGHVGLGLLHAFSFGVPVVTYQVSTHAPEFENLKDEENGLLVDPDNDELARALLRLTLNPDFAMQLGRSAFRTYEDAAHPDKMVEQFIEAIEYAMNARL